MGELSDTIAAVATPMGRGALAVVRVSGPEAWRVAARIFRLGRNKRKVEAFRERYVHYGFVVDPETGEVQDEVTLIPYRGPKSYTTEDMVEIICHGGYVSPRRVLAACLKAGARLAEPGEFTKRAFLGGRIDLTEAEAVLEVIDATGERSHSAALKQLSGGLRRRVEAAADRLKEMLMLVEACIDFPEEEIDYLDPGELAEGISSVQGELKELLSLFETSRRVREGIPIAIVGKPNVGKSSLLNALLKRERAIVTDIPGTTRDTVEEEVSVKGVLFRLIDTAGIRMTEDPVERVGVQRSVERLKEAQLVLFVLDASAPLDERDARIASLVRDRRHIVVLNKMDLPPAVSEVELETLGVSGPVVRTSAKLHRGIKELQDAMLEASGVLGVDAHGFLVNERHADVLRKAVDALERCKVTLESGLTGEFVAIDLREAIDRLGELTGRVTTDEILNMIFERFCIGK